MKRTNISLTDEQYEWLKKEAFANGASMSQVVRYFIEEQTTFHPEKKPQVILGRVPRKTATEVKFLNRNEFNPQPKKGKKK